MSVDPLTIEGRNELRQLYAQATRPGPWAYLSPDDTDDEDRVGIYWAPNGPPLIHDLSEWNGADEDAALIVAAVNALPALLDALDEAECEIERQHGDLVIERRHGTAQYRRAEKSEAQLAEAQDTIRGYESAVEGLATTIGEQRQQLSAIREYAQSLHALADTTRDAGGDYLAHTYREIATALERKIGDKP